MTGNSIYKINHLLPNNVIQKITVFYGKYDNITSLNELFQKDSTNILFTDKLTGKPIFNEEELQNIKNKNISVVFSEQQIHYDDSINVIKLKLFIELKEITPVEEMYLFYITEDILNSASIYQSLTKSNFSQDIIKEHIFNGTRY
jgi:hypothetical protein